VRSLCGVRQLGSLGPLASLSQLRRLEIDGCGPIDSIAPLAEFTALRSVRLARCRLRGAQVLASAPNLVAIEIEKPLIVSTPLASPAALARLIRRLRAADKCVRLNV